MKYWGIPVSALAVLLISMPSAVAKNDFVQEVLAAHNAARAALNLPPLVWNRDLAIQAEDWAEHVAVSDRPGHSPQALRPGQGENIWGGTIGAFTPTEMVGGWLIEKENFRNGPFPDVLADPDAKIPGHYTQIIWRDTTDVGCGMASAKTWDVLVCRYAPAGNVMGERPY